MEHIKQPMDLFFQLLQVAVGRREALSRTPSAAEWQSLFDTSVRQSLVGVCATGVERLPDCQRPPRRIAVYWAFHANKIEQFNALLNDKCAVLTDLLAADGYRSCVLKGQGMASLYPNPLRRQPGDIDILVWPRDAVAGDVCMDRIVDYVRRHGRLGKIVYHHADMQAAIGRTVDGTASWIAADGADSVEVEVHYRPSWFFSPLRNRRFQRWYNGRRDTMAVSTAGGFFMPDDDFNAVYILTHIFRHLFDEGIGLRQLLDYYYVLMRLGYAPAAGRADLKRRLRRLGLYRFGRAVMYVLQQVFGLDEAHMPLPPDGREGRFLLDEVMLAGNFGRYDERSMPHASESLGRRFARRQRRVSRFLVHYPEETVFAPLWTLWQRAWRRVNGYLDG